MQYTETLKASVLSRHQSEFSTKGKQSNSDNLYFKFQ